MHNVFATPEEMNPPRVCEDREHFVRFVQKLDAGAMFASLGDSLEVWEVLDPTIDYCRECGRDQRIARAECIGSGKSMLDQMGFLPAAANLSGAYLGDEVRVCSCCGNIEEGSF